MKKVILMILDGYGEAKPSEYNAVTNAKTPFLHSLKKGSYSLIKTDSAAVGQLDGIMGGSEVGHTTIGAGRVVPSTVKAIYDDMASGAFSDKPELVKMLKDLKENKGDLHLVGLMSDKNVHGNINHCLEIVSLAKNKARNIYIHFITDGRDCGVHDSLKYLTYLENKIKDIKNCSIVSVSGRAYTMDRDMNLDKTERSVNALFKDSGNGMTARKYIISQHEKDITDEFIVPQHIGNSSNIIKENDYVFFFNFREDRLRQMVSKTLEITKNVITMADVKGGICPSLYHDEAVQHGLSEYLSNKGIPQIKISETTKYAHVTYFFNGGREEPFDGEDRIHIPTIKTNDFTKTPKMRAREITKAVKQSIDKEYACIIVNYSNPDMIGHTGDYNAALKTLKCVDKCVKSVVKYAKKHNYAILITADHGNIEEMRKLDGSPHTAHTLNRVFAVAIDKEQKKMKKYGELEDIAPTLLSLMEIEKNPYFEGKSLIN